MARGNPDYNSPDYTFFYIDSPNSDIIAERQGFSRLDNRGRVIWCDDFRTGLNRWAAQNSSGGALPVHVYSDDLAIGYSGAIKFDCLVNNGISMIDNNLVLPVSKKIGVEVGVRLISNFGDFEIQFEHIYQAGSPKAAYFYIESGTGKLIVYDNLVRTTIYTPPLLAYILNGWIAVKFVIDVENNRWVRALLGNQQFDLSNYSLRSGTQGLQGSTSVLIRNTGTSATLKEEWYVGYVVISGDEP